MFVPARAYGRDMIQHVSSSALVTVVVTGVGAIIGQGIVRSLRQCSRQVRVVGIDRNANSLGPYLCDAFYPKPSCSEASPDYMAFWQKILIDESVDLVLPGLEVDLDFLNAERESLGEAGARLGLNTAGLIELAGDKWLLTGELKKLGIEPIPTITTNDWDECCSVMGSPPFLLKPRQGSGSRGIVRLYDEVDLAYWTRHSEEGFLIQKIMGTDDEEYTVGSFGCGDGNSPALIIFRRYLSSAGNTQYAEVVEDDSLQKITETLNRHFKPVGPTNYQFRKDHGIPYLLEINPRFSSSGSLRTAFGYNEAEMALTFYLDGKKPDIPHVTSGNAWRYAEDFVLK